MQERAAPMRSDRKVCLQEHTQSLKIHFCLNLTCRAARVLVSVPDKSHAHVSTHQDSERPSVRPGAVLRLQDDRKYLPRPTATRVKGQEGEAGPPLRLLMFLQGEAASEISKAPSDNSTNYCSLQNLLDGKYRLSRLPNVSDFHLNVIS